MPRATPPKLDEMGLAEFAAALVGEVQQALASAQAEQERRLAELAEVAAQPDDAFARQHVTDAQVDAEMRRLFPAPQRKTLHHVYVGARYRPRTAKAAEKPPFAERLGVTLVDEHFTRTRGVARLADTGVAKVRDAVRVRLAQPGLTSLRRVVHAGVPRVVVDAGKVAAKVAFRIAPPAAATKGATRAAGSGPATLTGRRLMVRPAGQPTTDAADAVGEIEIAFKTVP